ncbi:MAG: condensation domain-containing protein, partial [Candidatus Angelobacter sp.]
MEEILAQIWAEVLRLDRVSVDQNFFELGGDSILAIQAVARANKKGFRLKPQDLFENQTICGLAAVAAAKQEPVMKQTVLGKLPLTPAQRWFLEQGWQFPQHCNQSVLLKASAPLAPACVEAATQAVLARHESLQLRFHCRDGEWEQTYSGFQHEIIYTLIDLSHLQRVRGLSAMEAAAARIQSSLNISEGPLIRIVQFVLGNNVQDRLLIVVHHLAVDVVSWLFLLDDLQTAAGQISRGEPLHLLSQSASYPEWALALQRYVDSGDIDSECEYWGALERSGIGPLPSDFPSGTNDVRSRDVLTVCLNAAETKILLKHVTTANRCEVLEILLAAAAAGCNHWTGQNAVLLDMEGHGRESIVEAKSGEIDVSSVVGWFTTIYPMLIQIAPDLDLRSKLRSVKNQFRAVPRKGAGYGLLRYMGRKSAQQMLAPQSQISFNFLGVIDHLLGRDPLFSVAAEFGGNPHSPVERRRYVLEITGKIVDGQLWFDFGYSRNLHRRGTIHGLAENVLQELRRYTIDCCVPADPETSDFRLASLNEKDLDTILK